jgi:phosphate-selective porin OprO/OprP
MYDGHKIYIFGIAVLLIAAFLFADSSLYAKEEAPPPGDMEESEYDGIMKNLEEGVWVPYAKWHIYGKEGLRIDSPEKNFTMRINTSIMIDGGYISADEELAQAFPDLEGSEIDLRWLRVHGFGTIYDWGQFKVDVDFANIRDIKDNWIRFTKVPFIDHFTIGHMKEPISMEGWTGLKAITFMERALPVDAFWIGRNIGIRRHTTEMDGRLTWAVGAFLNTGSFSNFGDARNQISKVSYSHLFRDTFETDTPSQLRARPESRLTDDRFVDTGKFLTDGGDIINPEFAMVTGPLSFQGEYFHVFHDASALGDPNFWGFYLYGSYFLTGEYRNYGRRSGTFFRLKPKQNFHPQKGGWGAWEVAARFSHVDLNGGAIRGGKEANFTAGLNWYLTRNTRFMFNYIRAKVKDRETPPSVDSGRAHIFQARFQIEF